LATIAGTLGVLDGWWPVVALAGYCGTWLLPSNWWARRSESLSAAPATFTLEECVQRLRQANLAQLPPAALALLENTLSRLEALDPKLAQLEANGVFPPVARGELLRLARVHLPGTLSAFLAVPAGAARTQLVLEDKTAEDLLLEQLRLLRGHVQGLEAAASESDVQALLVQHTLLRERFGVTVTDGARQD
jgi:hypothetical protein